MAPKTNCDICALQAGDLVEVIAGWFLCAECAADWRRDRLLLPTVHCCVCGRLVVPDEGWVTERSPQTAVVVWCADHAAQRDAEMRARQEASEHEFWHPEEQPDAPMRYLFLRLMPLMVRHEDEDEPVPVVGKGTVSSVVPPDAEERHEVMRLSIEDATSLLESRGWERDIAQWRVGSPEDTFTIWRFRRRL